MSTSGSDPTSEVPASAGPDAPGPDAIAGFELLNLIGQGGFATVYRGRDTVIGREVAIKIDRRVLLNDSDRRRFAREVTAAGRVSAHPNIVTLLSGGITEAGRPYLVMELCPGGSLAGRMKAGSLSAQEVVHVGIAVADALAAAHAAEILHRDVKPANILVTSYGAYALSDFGLASLPADSQLLTLSQHALTPSYAAPEVFERNAASPTADVFSLGATLYALLCGRPPRSSPDGPPSLVQLLELSRLPLPRLDIPAMPELNDVIARATAPDVAERTPSAVVLRDELMALARRYMPGADVHEFAPGVVLPPYTSSAAATPTVVHTPSGTFASSPMPERPATDEASVPISKRTARRRFALPIAGVLALFAVGAVGAWLLSHEPDPASAGSNQPGTALPTAPSVAAIDPAELPQVGSCWSGLVSVSGGAPTSREIPCGEPHRWTAFATGTLDPDTHATRSDSLDDDPVIALTCTEQALSDHLRTTVPDGTRIEHLGPRDDLAARGDRTFVCLFNTGQSTTTAQ